MSLTYPFFRQLTFFLLMTALNAIFAFMRGDCSTLRIDNSEVARGTVHKVDPTATVQKMVIGVGRIAVQIDDVCDPSRALPIPMPTARFVGDALDAIVVWDVAQDFYPNMVPSKGAPLPIPEVSSCGSESSTEPTIKVGDVVLMSSSTDAVFSAGKVFSISPGASCHNTILGEGRLSIEVTDVIVGSHVLPYPHADATTVEEALFSFVMWDTQFVQKKTTTVGFSAPPLSAHLPGVPADPSFQSNTNAREFGIKITAASGSKDFLDRKTWIGEGVSLLSKDTQVDVGWGIISHSHHAAPVDDELLGQDNVWVMVKAVSDRGAFPSLRGNPNGVLGLIRWPIASSRLAINGRLLSDLVDKEDEFQSTGSPLTLDGARELFGIKRKRSYGGNRTKMDPEEKRAKDRLKRANSKITDEFVDKLHSKKCCAKTCLWNVLRGDLSDVIKEYMSMCCDDRVTHILSFFHNSNAAIDNHFVVKGNAICFTAFHSVHGFERSQFYRYKRQYGDGAKVGYHGNKGSHKTREITKLCRATLEKICIEGGEPLPHLPYTGENGTDTVEYCFPLSMDFKDLYQEVRMAMAANGQDKCCSDCTLCKRRHFDNFKFHSKGNAFAICDPCVIFENKCLGGMSIMVAE